MRSTTSMRPSAASAARTCRCPMPPTSSASPCRRSGTWWRRPRRSATADASKVQGNAQALGNAMPIELLMPALSPTMTEGNLARWLKKEGDHISAGEVIAEIETDKATMEVEAVDEGTLGKIVVAEGSEGVPVNAVIGLILEDGEDSSALEDFNAEAPAKAETPTPAPKEEPSAP